MDDTAPHTPHGLQIATPEVEEKFRDKLSEMDLKEKEREVRVEAESSGLGYVNLVGFPVDAETLLMIPEEQSKAMQTVAFFRSGNELRVGSVVPDQPGLLELLAEAEQQHHVHVVRYQISSHSLAAVVKIYEHLPHVRQEVRGVEITAADLDKYRGMFTTFQDLSKKVHAVSLTDVFTMILAGALQARATDVHIEAEETDVKVRYRVDGVLHTVATLPRDTWKRVVNRIKLLAHLKINVEDKPQDGSITISLTKDKIDVRVSTLPTEYGESVALRLLMASSADLTLEDLGLQGPVLKQLQREVTRPSGLLLTSGPTGSGKTTTLYAILNQLNTPDNKIITLEDPVEYKLKGVNQSQVDAEHGYTFAKGLRSILRQDPDIIMVGEIRDLDTAEIAIQATLTGHLVLSTVHTNNAAQGIPRLLAMGVKPFLLAPGLNALMAQRLVRRVCEHCREAAPISEELLARVEKAMQGLAEFPEYTHMVHRPFTFYRGRGCKECQDLGYHGRIGIFELLVKVPEIEKEILSAQVSEYEIAEIGRKRGMISMVQDGILKALAGITTVEEVFRVAEEKAHE